MHKKIIFLFFLVMACGFCFSQKKLSFKSQNYIGLLEGEDGSSFQLQTVNGFQYAGWFTGIGTGLDYYRYRSIPVFLSLNKSFGNKTRNFFLLLDGGLNYAWVKKQEPSRWNQSIEQDFKPGLFWASGLGYKIGLKNKDAILINLSYSYKHIKETKLTPVFCINPPCVPLTERYDYKLNRVSIKLGWEL